MNQNINLKIQNFKRDLKNLINNSQLPIGVIYPIFENFFIKIEQQYYATLNTLALQEKNEQNTIKQD